MSKIAHKIYRIVLASIVILTIIILCYIGIPYYNIILEERFFHPDHTMFKPSGILGHGLGIAGSLLIFIGVFSYILRKRFRKFSRIGILKYWLEFHIFLCTLGPIMILFHTSFKFGGLVAISFWSMVAVFLSGIIGRFIYIQIPRTIEGRELSLNEVREMKNDIGSILSNSFNLDKDNYSLILESTKSKTDVYHENIIIRFFKGFAYDLKIIKKIKTVLKNSNFPKTEYKKVLKLVKNEISLNRRIERLLFMQNLFKYWHVAHLPFALVMLIIMVIHVVVTIVFGFKWIF